MAMFKKRCQWNVNPYFEEKEWSWNNAILKDGKVPKHVQWGFCKVVKINTRYYITIMTRYYIAKKKKSRPLTSLNKNIYEHYTCVMSCAVVDDAYNLMNVV